MAENPYQYNSPISDPARFAGRQEAFAFVQRHLVGEHQTHALAILAAPQMGKSSFLRQLPYHLDERYCPVRLSLRAGTVAGEAAWLSALAGTVPEALAALNMQSARLPDLPARPGELREVLLGDYLADGLHALRRGRHLLALVDNAERLHLAVQNGNLPADSFVFLARLLAQHAHFDLLLAFDARYETELMAAGPPLDAAFSYRLRALPREELVELLTLPVAGTLSYEGEALAAIGDLTAGHPYLAQVMGWLLFERAERRGHRQAITAADVEAVIERALAMTGDVLGEGWAHGSQQDRLVLTALSALSPDEPPTPVPHDDLGAWLLAANHPLDPRTVNATWRRLEHEDVVQLVGGGLVLVGGLRRRWLRAHALPLTAEGRQMPWRRIGLLVALLVALLAVLLAILSALPGPLGAGAGGQAGATITLDADLQATDDAYRATQTAIAP